MRTAPRSTLHSVTRRSRSAAAIAPGASAAASSMRCESCARSSSAVVISGVGHPVHRLVLCFHGFPRCRIMVVLPCSAAYLWFIINEEHSHGDHGKGAGITIRNRGQDDAVDVLLRAQHWLRRSLERLAHP